MGPLERAGYLAHGATHAHERRLLEAREIIANAAGCCVSVSWGKDSVVLLSLVAEIRPDVVVLNARYPNQAERFADMDRVRDATLAMREFSCVRYIEVDTPGEWEMYERAGGGFSDPATPDQRAAVRWWKANLDTNMGAARDAAGCSGVMLGLRAEESRARAMNSARRGADYFRSDGNRIVQPLMRWSGRDIWAHLVRHGLPWLRIYDMASAGRERARSGFVFATSGSNALRRHGVWDDWKRAYPNEYSAWMARFPELDK